MSEMRGGKKEYNVVTYSERNLESMMIHKFVDIESSEGVEGVMHCERSRDELVILVCRI
jgi:hypothetical protein